jgi:hypothetical protein
MKTLCITIPPAQAVKHVAPATLTPLFHKRTQPLPVLPHFKETYYYLEQVEVVDLTGIENSSFK